MEAIAWIIAHRNSIIKAIFGLSVALLVLWGISLYKQNKKLSESLEMALNNIEAYQGLLNDSLLANNVLLLSYDEMVNSRDSVLLKLDSVRNELKIKPKHLDVAATQTLSLVVNAAKELKLDSLKKDTIYSDSILYNALTKVYYTIGKDTINIGLDIKNTQYQFMYSYREYKNKKNFFKRLFTWDWKKVWKHEYNIVNTNELLDTQDVRIVEINKK